MNKFWPEMSIRIKASSGFMPLGYNTTVDSSSSSSSSFFLSFLFLFLFLWRSLFLVLLVWFEACGGFLEDASGFGVCFMVFDGAGWSSKLSLWKVLLYTSGRNESS